MVADVHVGKEHVFGRSGIAVPGGISEATLQKLFTLVDRSRVSTLMVLGDFMHAAPLPQESWLVELSQQLDQRPRLTVHIVAGNHDKVSGRSLVDSRVVWHPDRLLKPPFVLQHEPANNATQLDQGYVLAGHLHPAWRVGHSRKSAIRAPVFWCNEHTCVLPAFGEFTGGKLIHPRSARDRIYMVGEDCVVDVSTALK